MDFLFTAIFIFAFGIVIFGFINNFCQWVKNNHSPRLTVDAIVTGKREKNRSQYAPDWKFRCDDNTY